MAHSHDDLYLSRFTILGGWVLLFMVIAVVTLLIVRIRNYLRGEEGLSVTMPPVLKFVNLPLIVRCTLIWAGIIGVLFLVVTMGLALIAFPVLIMVIIAMSILPFSLFLIGTSMVSVLLSWAKVRSATLIMSALLPVPFIAFIGPYDYLCHDPHDGLGSRIGIDIGLGLLAIPSAIFWAMEIWQDAYWTTESGRLPPSEESGAEEDGK